MTKPHDVAYLASLDDKVGLYLNELRANRGLANKAMRKIGITSGELAKARRLNPGLMEQEQQILKETAEEVEQELLRRAIDGVEVPIFNKTGEIIGYRTDYSDQLLLAAAKARLPEKYGDKKTIEGKIGGSIKVVIRDFSDEIQAIATEAEDVEFKEVDKDKKLLEDLGLC